LVLLQKYCCFASFFSVNKEINWKWNFKLKFIIAMKHPIRALEFPSPVESEFWWQESTYSRVNCSWESKKIALNKIDDHHRVLSILPSVMQFRIYRVYLKVCFRFGVVSLHSDDIHCYTITHYRSEWMKAVLNFGNVDGKRKNGVGNLQWLQ
jgi:hypothetical protein